METQTGGSEDNIPDVLKKAVRAACLRYANVSFAVKSSFMHCIMKVFTHTICDFPGDSLSKQTS